MLYIQLDESCRAEANELVKLFLAENDYTYISTESEAIQQNSSGDWLMQFELVSTNGGVFLHGSLTCNGEAIFQDQIVITAAGQLNEILSSSLDQNDQIPITAVGPIDEVRLFGLDQTHRLPITVVGRGLSKKLKTPLKLLLYGALNRLTGKTLPWGALTGIRPVKIVNTLLEKGESLTAVAAKMQDYYKLSPEKTRLAIDVAVNERKYLTINENSISIYIGIPFCTSRCLYCSFPSVSTERYGNCISDYLKALEKEVQWTAAWLKGNGRILDTVYIGGGTPTALPEKEFNRLLHDIVPILPVETVREYTVEAGRPDTITREKLRSMKDAGVSRISVNPQTMQDKTLVKIGRSHTARQFVEAFQMAREEGFHNINCDLIAGLPDETLSDFESTLEQIRALKPESVTVHTMSLKRASRLNEEKEHFTQTTDDVVAAMVDLAAIRAGEMGFLPYYLYRQKNILANLENVGYARPGFEGIYNILIMEEIQTILALGAGATSKVVYPDNRIERIFNVKNVEQYIQRIDEMLERKATLLGPG